VAQRVAVLPRQLEEARGFAEMPSAVQPVLRHRTCTTWCLLRVRPMSNVVCSAGPAFSVDSCCTKAATCGTLGKGICASQRTHLASAPMARWAFPRSSLYSLLQMSCRISRGVLVWKSRWLHQYCWRHAGHLLHSRSELLLHSKVTRMFHATLHVLKWTPQGRERGAGGYTSTEAAEAVRIWVHELWVLHNSKWELCSTHYSSTGTPRKSRPQEAVWLESPPPALESPVHQNAKCGDHT
jgi:hypothetical protein